MQKPKNAYSKETETIENLSAFRNRSEIENRIQVPSDQNINIEAPNEAEKERNVARYMRNKVEPNILGPNNGITDAKNISHMQDRNTIGEINSSNSTTNDLVVGSLNLVGVLLTYLASN